MSIFAPAVRNSRLTPVDTTATSGKRRKSNDEIAASQHINKAARQRDEAQSPGAMTMTPGELRRLFANLKVWSSHGVRAPHKPLLALWAIGRCLRDEARLATYDKIAPEVEELLCRFGPPRKRAHPEAPFWHLQSDNVWEVPEAERITLTKKGGAHIASLRAERARGGLPSDVHLALQQDNAAALDIAYSLLDAHFPDNMHDEILEAVGINTTYPDDPAQEFVHVRRRPRDQTFSRAVLQAYREQCAVCAFSVRIRGMPVALEAAHIRWHHVGGADRDKVSNGLSLCAMHHRLFDRGAFTLSPKHTVVISPKAAGAGRDQFLERFARKPIILPEKTEDYPGREFLKWHHGQVFGPVTEGADY